VTSRRPALALSAVAAALALALSSCTSGSQSSAADDNATQQQPADASADPAAGKPRNNTPARSQDEPSQDPPAGDSAPLSPHQRLVDAMTVAELARQVQVVAVAGTRARRVTAAEAARNSDDFGLRTPAEVAGQFRPGGIVYFSDNVASVTQVRRLSSALHRVSNAAGVPVLLAADQEGGAVSRLPGEAATSQPAARDLGGDPRLAYSSARGVGRAMAAMGLDVDFAPVADVDTVAGAGVIGDRAFGTEPGVVSRMVRAQTCGYHRGGVAVALKHWPGHGATPIDSHTALPTVRLPRATWRREHLPPFVTGIAAGADMVMTGHLVYPRLDSSRRPASLSQVLTQQWLRQRLGFEGVIVTDALEMAAVAERGTAGDVAVQALRSGADLLLMSSDPAAAAAGIQRAVAAGRLERDRLERSVLRVLAVKARTGLLGAPTGSGGLAGCGR
jgi:beta-N-acetylhexosaminidase